MADLTTLAKPYAKAAFEYANAHNVVGDWVRALGALGTIAQDSEFVRLLDNPSIDSVQKATVLLDVLGMSAQSPMQVALHELGASLPEQARASLNTLERQDVSTAVQNFVQDLAQNGRLALLPYIAQSFEKMRASHQGQVDAYIVSAYPLDDEMRARLQTKLVDRFNAVVILHESVDESLLGGLTIKVGDKFIDGSVRGKLTQLQSALLQ